jgi:hypothetical protein
MSADVAEISAVKPYAVGEAVFIFGQQGERTEGKVWLDEGGASVEIIALWDNVSSQIRSVPRQHVRRLKWGWMERAQRAEAALYAMHRRTHTASECSFCRAFLSMSLSEGY